MSRYLSLLLGVASTVLAIALVPRSEGPHQGGTRSIIEGYRIWHKVNPKPIRVRSVFAMLCRGPSPAEQKLDRTDPHKADYNKDKFITVFVNKPGKRAMLSDPPGPFPIGSVIVKEKLPSITSRSPELMTVMVKRQKGFNPACGDWEFLVYRPGKRAPDAQGKLASCQSCHVQVGARSHVFANYVPGSEYDVLPLVTKGNK